MPAWWLILATVTVLLLAGLVPVAFLFGRVTLRAWALLTVALAVVTVTTYDHVEPCPDSTTCSTDTLFMSHVHALADKVAAPTLRADDASVGIVTWAVLALVAVLAYHVLDIVSTRKDPVLVEVGALRNATEGSAQAVVPISGDQAGSLLRATLARQLVTRAQVPGPRRPVDLPGLLATIDPGDTSWVGKVAAYVAGLVNPVTGWHVAGAVVVGEKGPSPCGVVLEVSSRRTGNSVLVSCYWASDWEGAIEQAAYDITARALGRCATIPGWMRWRAADASGLRAYHEGVSIKESRAAPDKLERQERAFLRARFADPANGLAALELAYTFEARARELEEGAVPATPLSHELQCDAARNRLRALVLYTTFARRHRQFIQARYRMAISLQHPERFMAAEGTAEWDESREALKDYLDECATRFRTVPAPRWSDRPTPLFFIALARAEFAAIDRDLHRARLAGWCARREFRALFLKWSLVTRDGQRARHSVRSAAVAADLSRWRVSRGAPFKPDADLVQLEARLDRVVRRGSRLSGLPAYNAACFYALQMDRRPVDDTASEWERDYAEVAHKSTKLLSRAVRNPREAYPPMTYLRNDPDLAALREHPTFIRWWTELGGTDDTTGPAPSAGDGRIDLPQARASAGRLPPPDDSQGRPLDEG